MFPGSYLISHPFHWNIECQKSKKRISGCLTIQRDIAVTIYLSCLEFEAGEEGVGITLSQWVLNVSSFGETVGWKDQSEGRLKVDVTGWGSLNAEEGRKDQWEVSLKVDGTGWVSLNTKEGRKDGTTIPLVGFDLHQWARRSWGGCIDVIRIDWGEVVQHYSDVNQPPTQFSKTCCT